MCRRHIIHKHNAGLNDTTPLELNYGYLLDELKNDITREPPASFEPSIDYVVTKIPRFAFEVLAHGHHSASRPHAHHADEKRG